MLQYPGCCAICVYTRKGAVLETNYFSECLTGVFAINKSREMLAIALKAERQNILDEAVAL
jgi:hypothetical protein